MADMMDTLKSMLGEDADTKINAIKEILNKSGSEPAQQEEIESEQTEAAAVNNLPNSAELLMHAQKIIQQLSSDGNDQRTNLLMALKPYLRNGRQSSIDNAVKMLEIAQLSQLFKGGLPL